MEFSPPTASALVLLAIAVGAAGLVAAIVALHRQRRVRRAYEAFSLGSRDDVLTLLQRHIGEVSQLRNEVGELRRHARELRDVDRDAVSRVGVIRYDAFEDMGGHMSFSAALLSERGDGVVVSAINGRTDTRIYAKPVRGWDSSHNLSGEELAAIEQAREGPRRRQPARPSRRPPGSADEARADAS